MDFDPTQRFSSRVENYARYRPSYPSTIIPVLKQECGLAAGARVADVGSGTGLLSRLFLDAGCEVFGVEPNAEMRGAGEHLLAGEPRFHSVDGRAENTALPDLSVDFVAAGQAFHWFEPTAAAAEFRRILKPPGWVVLVWNERKAGPGFAEDYDALLQRYAPQYKMLEGMRNDSEVLDRFFGDSRWRLVRLPNEQRLDREGLRGRVLSSSYVPLPGEPNCEPLLEGVDHLFAKYQRGGVIVFPYETKLYYGSLSAGPSTAFPRPR
jgi:SAM-dependent methyltransferase